MNLQPMSPTALAAGGEEMTLFCVRCSARIRSPHVLCDLDDKAGTYYCKECADILAKIQQDAQERLRVAGDALRKRLDEGDTSTHPWKFDDKSAFLPYRKGRLIVWRAPSWGLIPGVSFTSSMGRNSDDSYSGFLPYVTFDEALLLVYKPWMAAIKYGETL